MSRNATPRTETKHDSRFAEENDTTAKSHVRQSLRKVDTSSQDDAAKNTLLF